MLPNSFPGLAFDFLAAGANYLALADYKKQVKEVAIQLYPRSQCHYFFWQDNHIKQKKTPEK